MIDPSAHGPRARLSVHCLAIETSDGVVLADTGFGLGDVRHPRRRLSRFFRAMNRPALREEMTAVRQLARLGIDARDVRHIVMTHLDFDHAGGIEDFPEAKVHLLATEEASATARRTFLDRMRYRPQQWGQTRARWRTYTPGEGESFFGFSAVRNLEGVNEEILLVPLIGHTLGHAGVAVRSGSGHLFLTGDAYFWNGEMNLYHPRCTPGLAAYQWLMDKDHETRRWNQQRLRELKASHGSRVRIFSSHDPHEFERLAERPLEVPVPALAGPTRVSATDAALDPAAAL